MLTADRATVLGAAGRPTARAVEWPLVGGVVALGWAPLALTVVRGGDDLVAAFVFAAVVGTSAVAFCVDDDAAELTASVPVPLAERRAVRLLIILGALLVAASIVWAVGTAIDPAVAETLGNRLAEAAAVGLLALAWASASAQSGVSAAGVTGALAGSMSVGLVTMLAFRYEWLPGVGLEQHHDWWWVVAGVGAAVVAVTWRDPASRRS